MHNMRVQQSTNKRPRPERQGTTAPNSYSNVSDGRACVAMHASSDLQQLNKRIADAMDANGRVTVIDGDGNERTVFPIDAREAIQAGRAMLKGTKDA